MKLHKHPEPVEAAIKYLTPVLPDPDIALIWDGWDYSWNPDSLDSCLMEKPENTIIGYTTDQVVSILVEFAKIKDAEIAKLKGLINENP